MRTVIERALAGERVETWTSILSGTLSKARLSAESFGVTRKAMETAWRKHRERAERKREKEHWVPVSKRWRRKEVRDHYQSCGYREATHAHRLLVEFADTASAHSEAGKMRPGDAGLPNAYSKQGYWVTTSEHTIRVHQRWLSRVKSRGAAVVDGKFTLDLAPEPVPGTDAYAAVWVEQSRGTAVRDVHGWLVQTPSGWRHTKTLKRAA